MLITELKMTCTACPTQYEGRTVDGEYIYIRYRWGVLTLGIGNNINEAVSNRIIHRDFNDGWNGYISFNDLKAELLLHNVFIDDNITFDDDL